MERHPLVAKGDESCIEYINNLLNKVVFHYAKNPMTGDWMFWESNSPAMYSVGSKRELDGYIKTLKEKTEVIKEYTI